MSDHDLPRGGGASMESDRRHWIIQPLRADRVEPLARLLQESATDYVRFFHPFAFEPQVIAPLVTEAVKDQWFSLEVEEAGQYSPVGLYMLRGLDEGFDDPMYGVFVAESWSGCGLGRLTIAHAEAQCRLNGWKELLLKVHPDNRRAFRLYEAAGFRFRRKDSAHGEHVLAKTIAHA